jgi:hypothetical protein
VVDSQPDAPIDAGRALNGFVVLSNVDDGTMASSGAAAFFVEGSPFGTVTGTSGSCTGYLNPPATGYSAGTITVTGTAAPLTLTPMGASPNVRYDSTPPHPLFTSGAAITVTAAGADAPAFSTMLTGPAAMTGFTPPASISQSAGYNVTWTAGTAPGVWIFVADDSTSSNDDWVICRVSDTGSFMLTPAIFALLSSTNEIVMLVGRVDNRDVTAGIGTTSVVGIDALESDTITLTP